MRIELKYGDATEEISCSDKVFFVGLRYFSTSEIGSVKIILFETDEIFDNASIKTIEKQLPDGSKLLIDCFLTDDPAYQQIIKLYNGVKALEFSYRDLEVTTTL